MPGSGYFLGLILWKNNHESKCQTNMSPSLKNESEIEDAWAFM